MKKIVFITSAVALLSAGLMAQNPTGKANKKNFSTAIKPTSTRDYSTPTAKEGQLPNRGCGTKIPVKQWDETFNKMVEAHKQDLVSGRTTATTYTIPIIFHIIYTSGEAVGTGHNISQAQVNSQIPILNADYNGTGVNTNLYAAMTLSGHQAFYDYAQSAGLPAPDNNGTIIASSGITFCLATKDTNGTTLAEPGIDRVTWESISGATDPASSNVETLMDNTIKPATIWNPQKYFNVWTSDGGSSGLLGYSTFPPLNTSTGVFNSQGEGVSNVSTTDGVWVCYTSLGNTGNVSSPYNLGRTLTHESGHYFGLRHIWGDGSCVTDYCNDTPPAGQANYVNCGTAYPYEPNSCTGTPPNGNGPDGDMYMNFMFTTDQVARFTTALASSPWRSGLTTSAANLCAGVTVSTPVASFTPPASICSNVATQFTDASSGPPTSWNWSVSPSTGVTITTNTVANPSITFTAAGTYTVTDAVSNSAGNSSVSQTVAVTSCAVTTCDTLSNFINSDSLTVFQLPSDSGYVSGNNIYGDLAKAEFYNASTLANTQITGVICLFFKNGTDGTKGTGTVSVDILNATSSAGPTGAALGTATASLASIAATTPVTQVTYCGNPGLAFGAAIMIPYKFTFATPVITPSGGFVASLNLPTTTGDTLVVFQNTAGNAAHTASTAWELNAPSPGTWALTQTDWNFTNPSSFAILPIVCPRTVGISQNNILADNIAFFPNPSNGQVNFAITLDAPTDLTVSVVNMLGQVVSTKVENNISHAVLNYDYSSLSKGVYFVNIIDSQNNKTTKKMIIQ